MSNTYILVASSIFIVSIGHFRSFTLMFGKNFVLCHVFLVSYSTFVFPNCLSVDKNFHRSSVHVSILSLFGLVFWTWDVTYIFSQWVCMHLYIIQTFWSIKRYMFDVYLVSNNYFTLDNIVRHTRSILFALMKIWVTDFKWTFSFSHN